MPAAVERRGPASDRGAGYESYRVGDRVYCLAWIGQPFDVVAKDDERRVIGIETPPGWPTFAQVGIADASWLRPGPTVALRLEMRLYRWCITFGEIVLDWEDFRF